MTYGCIYCIINITLGSSFLYGGKYGKCWRFNRIKKKSLGIKINIRPNEMLAKLIDTEDMDYKDIIGTHGLLIPKENQYYTML